MVISNLVILSVAIHCCMTANLESVVVKVVVNSSYNQIGNLKKKKELF